MKIDPLAISVVRFTSLIVEVVTHRTVIMAPHIPKLIGVQIRMISKVLGGQKLVF